MVLRRRSPVKTWAAIGFMTAYFTNLFEGFPGLKRPQFHIFTTVVGAFFGWQVQQYFERRHYEYRMLATMDNTKPKWTEFFPHLDETPEAVPDTWQVDDSKPYWYPYFSNTKRQEDYDEFFKDFHMFKLDPVEDIPLKELMLER